MRLHARQLLRAAQQLFVEGAPARFVVSLLRDVHRRVEHVRRIEPEVHRLRAAHAAHEQPRRDEQHERDRDLRDDEHAAGALASRAVGGAAPPSRSTELRSAREARSAGSSPTPTPAVSATAAI